MRAAHRCNWRCYPGYCADPYPKDRTMTTPSTPERHPATTQILRHFEYGHLPPHLAEISREVHKLAHHMVSELPDGPELTSALRDLLRAKDGFVRAAVDKAGLAG